ncbi:MAG TPA: hypothetical protein VE177_03980 [Candidatus Binatus sp.]|jgi:hypothetical protein|nr:hypothetical protein [Candidatus Binatus sp.]
MPKEVEDMILNGQLQLPKNMKFLGHEGGEKGTGYFSKVFLTGKRLKKVEYSLFLLPRLKSGC